MHLAHHLLRAYHHAHRVHAAGKRLAKYHHVRVDLVLLVRHEIPRPAQTRLDLVHYQQRAVLFAQVRDAPNIIVVDRQATCVALDTLEDDRGNAPALTLEGELKVLEVVESYLTAIDGCPNSGKKWTVSCICCEPMLLSVSESKRIRLTTYHFG